MAQIEYNSIQELIEAFKLDYYDQMIESLEQRRMNVQQGLPETDYEFVKGKQYFGEERVKRVKALSEQINELTAKKIKVSGVIKELKDNIKEVIKEAQKSALFVHFSSCVDLISKGQNIKKVVLNTQQDIFASTKKIDKNMYELIKKNLSVNVDVIPHDKYPIYISLGEQLEGLDYEVKDGKHGIFLQAYEEERSSYISDFNKLKELGIDYNILTEFIESEKRNNELVEAGRLFDLDGDKLTIEGSIAFKEYLELDDITKKYPSLQKRLDANKQRSQLAEIIKLSKTVWQINTTLGMFKSTLINKSDPYIKLEELAANYKKTLVEKSNKCSLMFKDSELDRIVEVDKQISELIAELDNISKQMYENTNNYEKNQSLVFMYNEKIKLIKQILKEYPELDNVKYDVILNGSLNNKHQPSITEKQSDNSLNPVNSFEKDKRFIVDENGNPEESADDRVKNSETNSTKETNSLFKGLENDKDFIFFLYNRYVGILGLENILPMDKFVELYKIADANVQESIAPLDQRILKEVIEEYYFQFNLESKMELKDFGLLFSQCITTRDRKRFMDEVSKYLNVVEDTPKI